MKPRNVERAQRMAQLYKSGKTMQEIAQEFGVTRERVRQILFHVGLAGNDGGIAERARQRKILLRAAHDKRYLDKYGCTYAQYLELRVIGRGKSYSTTPTGAFKTQRCNARQRGIEWKLSLWEWWQIWDASGKWESRGRGQGYVMSRVNDEGPYSVGNVFIATAIENCSNAPRKKKNGLPIGVRENHGRFEARRMLHGKKHYLGTFTTAEEAHDAWRAAA